MNCETFLNKLVDFIYSAIWLIAGIFAAIITVLFIVGVIMLAIMLVIIGVFGICSLVTILLHAIGFIV